MVHPCCIKEWILCLGMSVSNLYPLDDAPESCLTHICHPYLIDGAICALDLQHHIGSFKAFLNSRHGFRLSKVENNYLLIWYNQ